MSSSKSEPTARQEIVDPQSGLSLVKCSRLPVCGFDCGEERLNEWFARDSLISAQELMTQTFELVVPGIDEGGPPIALVAVCNDAILLRDLEEHFDVEEGKRFPTWPAVKIARLAVDKKYQRHGLGTQTINLIKQLFVCANRTGCRLLTLDAFNDGGVIQFYWKNDFGILHDRDTGAETRSMWFDLKRMIRNGEESEGDP